MTTHQQLIMARVMATCRFLDLFCGGYELCHGELYTIAAAYITERLAGTPTNHSSRDLLCKMICGDGISDKSVPGEYEQGTLLIDVLHEAFVYSADKGLGADDTVGLLKILASALKWVLTYNKTESLTREVAQIALEEILSAHSAILSSHGLVTAACYINRTVLTHLYLYHYLLTEDQERDHHSLNMPVYHMENHPAPLPEGEEKGEWEKKQLLCTLEEKHRKVIELMSIEKEKVLENQQQMIKELHHTCYSQIEQEMEEEVLKDVVEKVVKSQASQIMVTTMMRLKEKEMQMFHEIEKVEVLSAASKETREKKRGDSSRQSSRSGRSTRNK